MVESTTKRIAKNFSWLSVGDIVSRAFNFFAVIYIARVLGAAAFGLLNFAFALLAYLVLFVDTGLSLYGTREIAKAKEKVGVISLNIFILRLMIALIVFLLAFISLIILPITFEMRLLFIGASLIVFYRALNTDWAFQGLDRMEYVALARIIFSVLSFALIILIVRSSNDLVKVPYLQFIGGMISASIFLFILFRRFTRNVSSQLIPSNWWNYFSEAVPLGASAILIQIYYNMDTIMLGFMDRPEVVGFYSAAYKVFLVVLGFLGLWQSTAFPVVCKRLVSEKETALRFLRKYARLTFLVVIPIALLITLFAPNIIRLFFGIQYSSSFPALQILIWNIILIAISGIYGVLILIPLGHSRQFLYGVGSGAIINILLNLILIPPFSFVGAAIATLISEAFVTLIMFYFVRKILQLDLLTNLRIPIVASLIAALFLFIFIARNLSLLWLIGGIFFFLITYPSVILIFGEREFLLEFYKEISRKGKNR